VCNGEGEHVKKGIKHNILERMSTNRARIAEAREREEREAAAIRALNQKPKEQKSA